VLPHVYLHEDQYLRPGGDDRCESRSPQVAAGSGSYPIKPCGLMHTFRNACPGSARLFEVIAPASFGLPRLHQTNLMEYRLRISGHRISFRTPHRPRSSGVCRRLARAADALLQPACSDAKDHHVFKRLG
jgi:hypothetical protein